MKVRIKVCGVTFPAQLEALDEMGVDLAGFIFYSNHPGIW
jgi:phosphoribosylanthranilate isomerase